MAVALSGLTTITGFSGLMLARHQGVFSLGLVLTIGALAGLAASLIVLPVLLRLSGLVTAAAGRDVARRAASMIGKRLCVIVTALLPFMLAAAAPTIAGEPTERVKSTVDELRREVSSTATSSPKERDRSAVAYALERAADRPWRVQDVLVEKISLLEHDRTQFASIIARSSYQTLVQRLRSRVREHG